MERLESVTEKEQSHGMKLETVTKENCSTTKSSANKSPTNPERLQDMSASFASVLSSEKCCSDRTELESSQKVLRQTSEQPCTTLGSDFVLADSHAKTSRPGGSVVQSDTRRRPISYNFAGTRHESYGNLGIAGLAGLSSTSATLALLPLQATGHSRTTTVPLPPVTASSSVVTTVPPLAKMASTSGTTSLDLTRAEHDAKLAGASSRTAASVKDRRSTFFSEPPKPISLPTRSATQLSSLCGERSSLESQPLTNVPSPSKESNGPSLSVTSVPRSLSGTFMSATTVLETQSSLRLQDRPESSQLCPDLSRTLSSQHDMSPMPFSDQSVASMSDSDDTNFSVWCGPPPDDAADSEPASTIDTCIFELGMFFLLLVINLFWSVYFFIDRKKCKIYHILL